mmetsp:Transcript_4117/g.9673  ORF Transcript_4117/g.9673 Transcript_4117/m.9673 type:complete len:472 (-) Transcript_4117:14-1429(-)
MAFPHHRRPPFGVYDRGRGSTSRQHQPWNTIHEGSEPFHDGSEPFHDVGEPNLQQEHPEERDFHLYPQPSQYEEEKYQYQTTRQSMGNRVDASSYFQQGPYANQRIPRPRNTGIDPSEFRNLSEEPRSIHERWLKDWKSDRNAMMEAIRNREEDEMKKKADSWRHVNIGKQALSSWRRMLHLTWQDERRALAAWRRNSISRFLRKWSIFKHDKDKQRALHFVALEFSRLVLGKRVLAEMRDYVRKSAQRRESLVSTVAARVLILKCRWSIIRWRHQSMQQSNLKKKQHQLMLDFGLKRWKEFVKARRTTRRLSLLSSGLGRKRQVEEALSKWLVYIRHSRESKRMDEKARGLILRRGIRKWSCRTAEDIERQRYLSALQSRAILFWFKRNLAIAFEKWHLVWCNLEDGANENPAGTKNYPSMPPSRTVIRFGDGKQTTVSLEPVPSQERGSQERGKDDIACNVEISVSTES